MKKSDEQEIQKIIDTLLNAKRVLITGHMNPDGDSLGSQLGLAAVLEQHNVKYEIVNEGAIPHKYSFLPGVPLIQNIDSFKDNGHSFDAAVLIECSNIDRIGKVARLITNECTVINVDHHQDNKGFGDINFLDSSAAAAGEMVYRIIRHGDFAIDKAIATNLYTAILTDTGRFHYNSTTPQSLRVAADLLENGADTSEITDEVYFRQSSGSLCLMGEVLRNLEYYLNHRLCFMTITKQIIDNCHASWADTEGLVNYSLRAEGVLAGVLFTEKNPNVTKVSFRSRNEISIVDIAAKHDGGGHKNACGCTLPVSIEEAKKIILKDIEELLNGNT